MRKGIKKKAALFLAVCLGAALQGPPATSLAANRAPEIEIEAVLRQDGSARITQTWHTQTDEGTEFYLGCQDNGYLSVTDFSVADGNGAYTFVDEWDVDASFDEKAGKCGILETDGGVELCWGISEYGQRAYTVSYVLHGLVGGYSDADGFNHRFVDEMSVFPTDVELTICSEDGTPLNDDICDIWAFGFDGQIQFEDGVVRAWSEEPLESGQHMTVMVSLKKGVLAPLRTAEGSFEDVKERAFDGSDYEEDVTLADLLLGLAFFALLVIIIALCSMVLARIRKAKLNRRMQHTDYFRDVPNNGNLNVTNKLGTCCGLCGEDALLGAYLLRLISDGCLEPEKEAGGGVEVSLRLCHPPLGDDSYADALYTVLEAGAGADGVLQPKELEQYCRRNYQPLATFMDACAKDADQTLFRGGCLKGAACDGIRSLTEQGNRQLDELLGLKRFLLDFSLISEREITETIIWQDYMVYAMLFGIADRVTPQIKKLYPDALPQVERYERCMGYAGYYNGLMYGVYEQERQRREAARRAGSGGRSSIGGGGGSSGGGGGGSR